MEELILQNIRTFTRHIGDANPPSLPNARDDGWGPPKNMTEWADFLSFDIMGDICFSGSFGMLSKPDNRYILDVLPQGVNGLNIVGHPLQLARLCLMDVVRLGAGHNATKDW